MADNEQLVVLNRINAERAVRVLANQYPQRKFYYVIGSARDTNFNYWLYVEGRANNEIRTYAAGVADALRAL